jgi:hypothetical protein
MTKATQPKIALQTPANTDTYDIVQMEVELLLKRRTRSETLEKTFKMLLSVKPTSVESERVFSIAGLTLAPRRNTLRSELRYYIYIYMASLKQPLKEDRS